jgi:tetratricopeptide (TPR) repeat protein
MFELSGDEMVIGRGSDNAVTLPDTAVSRKHALLRKTDAGWALSDLGSGNGTVLNGEPVVEETVLSNQDVFSLGDSEFRFEGGARPAARRAPVKTGRALAGLTEPELDRSARGRPVRSSRLRGPDPVATGRRRKMFIIAGTVLGLLMVMGIGLKLIAQKKAQASQRLARAEGERVGELAKLFQGAKKMILEGRWAEAKAKMLEIQEMDADYEAASLKSYLERAEEEIPVQKALAEAAVDIKEQHFEAAAKALGSITKTLQEDRRKAVKDEYNLAFAARLNEGRVMSSATGDRTKMMALKALASDLVAAAPEDKGANELKKLAESAIARIDNPNLPPPPPETPHLQVQNLFRRGDVDGALSLAQQCAGKNAPCKTLEQQMRDFQGKMKRIDSMGPGELATLFELDRKIAGGQSSDAAGPIKTRLVSAFYMDASKAKTTGNWAKATEYARKVLLAEPTHPGAQSIVAEAKRQASELYLRAYQIRETSPEEAIKMFKDVMVMTPPDDEFHSKAKGKIEDLQK